MIHTNDKANETAARYAEGGHDASKWARKSKRKCNCWCWSFIWASSSLAIDWCVHISSFGNWQLVDAIVHSIYGRFSFHSWISLPIQPEQVQSHLRAIATPSVKSTLSGCCNQPKYDHLPIAYPQRSNVADQVGSLPYPGFSVWRSRYYPRTPHPMWWFYPWGFSRKFACHSFLRPIRTRLLCLLSFW